MEYWMNSLHHENSTGRSPKWANFVSTEFSRLFHFASTPSKTTMRQMSFLAYPLSSYGRVWERERVPQKGFCRSHMPFTRTRSRARFWPFSQHAFLPVLTHFNTGKRSINAGFFWRGHSECYENTPLFIKRINYFSIFYDKKKVKIFQRIV